MISDVTLSIGVQANVKLSTLAHQLAITPQPRCLEGVCRLGWLVGGACAEGEVAGSLPWPTSWPAPRSPGAWREYIGGVGWWSMCSGRGGRLVGPLPFPF